MICLISLCLPKLEHQRRARKDQPAARLTNPFPCVKTSVLRGRDSHTGSREPLALLFPNEVCFSFREGCPT